MYREISNDCKHAQTIIFSLLERHENQVLPTRDSYRDCSVAGRTNTGVIPVYSEQPDLDASVVVELILESFQYTVKNMMWMSVWLVQLILESFQYTVNNHMRQIKMIL